MAIVLSVSKSIVEDSWNPENIQISKNSFLFHNVYIVCKDKKYKSNHLCVIQAQADHVQQKRHE